MLTTLHRLMTHLFHGHCGRPLLTEANEVTDRPLPRYGIPDEYMAKLPPLEERFDTYETLVHHVETADPAHQPR